MRKYVYKSVLLPFLVILALLLASCYGQINPDDIDSDPTDEDETNEPPPVNLAPSAAFAVGDYEVSAAEIPAVNGYYLESDPVQSPPFYTQIDGSYKIFQQYLTTPSEGYWWCIDTDETTVNSSDLDYLNKGDIDDLPHEVTSWYTGSGTPSSLVLTSASQFSGSTAIGGEITVNYTFTDPDGDQEGNTIFRWFRCVTDASDDSGTLIDGAQGQSYILKVDDGGSYLRVEVTPFDEHNLSGTPVLSSASELIIN